MNSVACLIIGGIVAVVFAEQWDSDVLRFAGWIVGLVGLLAGAAAPVAWIGASVKALRAGARARMLGFFMAAVVTPFVAFYAIVALILSI